MALADNTGTLQTQYTYDPFGNTTTTGQANANSSKYTGREDDGTGLYYYRARYYSPSLQRFISEDPIGLGGGDTNLYAYVGNDPINFVDPSGLCGSFTPQTSAPTENPYPGCVTINWLFQQPFVAVALEEAWERTAKSGEENGLWAVYDATRNMVHVGVASQGRHIPDILGTSIPAMPDFINEYKKFIRDIGVPVTYITDAHTHHSHSDTPSGYDVLALSELGGSDAVGIIITDRGKYVPYSIIGKVKVPQHYLNECRTPKVSAPSVRVRFR